MTGFLILGFAALCAWAQPNTKAFNQALEELLRSPEYQATESEIRSIELDFASRDLELQPELQLSTVRVNENRQLLNATFPNNKPRIDTVSAILTKPFSTGTTISVGPSWERALTPNLTPDNRATFDWQITLSQSLWQDGFGRSTRLRRNREEYQRRTQLADALLRRGQVLFEFESLYWDWALAMRESELRSKNLKRSQEILRWVRDRYRRAAAENTDVLQAQALVSQSDLRVATVKQNLILAAARMERFVPRRDWLPTPKDLPVAREVDKLLTPWKVDDLSEVTLLDYLAASNDARTQVEIARERRESIRPELNLELAYGKNAIDTDSDAALRRSYREDHDYSRIGVVFRTGLDLGRERKLVESARATRDAAIHRADARAAESKVAWTELKKELSELQAQIDRAQELVDVRWRTANAERERYRKGRTTLFQAITFEADAAEAEIALWSLYASMRKTEARARLFAR